MQNIYNPVIDDIDLPAIIGYDSEFNSLDTLDARISAISITDPVKKVSYGLDLNSNIYSREDILALAEKIKRCKVVIAHNAKIDLGVFKSNFGILFRNFWCSMLASQKIDNGYGYPVGKERLKGTEYEHCANQVYFTKNMVGGIYMMESPHGLHGCLRRYLGVDLRDTINKKQLQKSFINLPAGRPLTLEQLEYACSDTQYLPALYEAEMKYIRARELEKQILLENTVTPAIVKMEHKGALVDIDQQLENIKNWKQLLYETELKLDAIIIEMGKDNVHLRGGTFANKRRKEEVIVLSMFDEVPDTVIENKNKGNINYSSSDQLGLIFKRAQLPLPTDDDGKISFSEEAIKVYMTNNPESPLKDFLALILDHREYSKLLSTYGEKLIRLLDKNGRMRTNYTQCFTNTNRLTSSAIIKDELGINLANIPKRNDVRKIFVPDPGYSFIDSDMTGQELVIVAGYSQEPVLMNAFKQGFDHHSFLASISYSIIFGQKVEIENKKKEIVAGKNVYDSKKLRDDHKNALFSMVYLGGPKRIQNVLNPYLVANLPPNKRFDACKKISEALHAALPKMISYLKAKVDEVQKKGYVTTTKWGLRRYFDHPEQAYGDAANLDIQATGSMCIKVALINIDKWFETKSKELGIEEEELGWLSMSIYDQNLICLNDNYLHLAPEIQEIMAKALTYFLVDLEGSSDLNIRKYWSK